MYTWPSNVHVQFKSSKVMPRPFRRKNTSELNFNTMMANILLIMPSMVSLSMCVFFLSYLVLLSRILDFVVIACCFYCTFTFECLLESMPIFINLYFFSVKLYNVYLPCFKCITVTWLVILLQCLKCVCLRLVYYIWY